MKHFLVPAMLVMMPFVAWAQINLSGKVTENELNQTMPGANIRLAGTYQSTVSNSSGEFFFSNLKPGTYTMVTSFLGYQNDTLLINLSKNMTVSVQLSPTLILQDEVLIQSTRAGSSTPVAYQNLEKKEIAQLNFGQDLPMLIGNSISAVSTSDAGNGIGYTALRIRGTDMTRINVTINGIPLNDPESHNVFWVDLPDFASSTDNIQIQRGVGTSTNGASAFGASINLKSTDLKANPYAELSSNYGSFNTLKNTLSFGTGVFNDHFSFDGRISSLSSDGYIDRAKSDLLSYYISGAYTSKKNIIRLNVFSGKEKTYQSWDGIPSEILKTNRTWNGMGAYIDNSGTEKYYDNETDNYIQTHYQALFTHQFSKVLYLNLAAHHTTGAGYYEQYRESDELENYGIQPVITNAPYYELNGDTIFTPDGKIFISDLIRRKQLSNTFSGLTWSFNYAKKKISSTLGGSYNTYKGNHFGTVIWSQFAGNSEINHEWYSNKSKKNDFNIFAKATYTLTDDLNTWIDLQLRHISYSLKGIDDDGRDISQNHNFTFFNPKAGIQYRINKNMSAYASLAIANREPNRDNFVDADLTKPAPKPETLYDFEAGYTTLSNNLTFTANAFYMFYTDQLVLTGAINDVGAPVMINIPVSYRAGLELSSKITVIEKLSWDPSLTLSFNKIKTYTEYIDDWSTWSQISVEHTNTDLAFSPSVIANSNLGWDITGNFQVSLISKYVGKQYIDNSQSTDRMLDAYFVNNLLVSWRFQPAFCREIKLSAMINNLLNTEYETNAWVYRYQYENELSKLDGYFPQAGISVMAGVTVKF